MLVGRQGRQMPDPEVSAVNDSNPKKKIERIGVMSHELRALAQEGLRYSRDSIHDERRYRQLLRIAAELAALDGLSDADATELRYLSEPPVLTPYAVADAAVLDSSGRILLIRREDDGLWAMPGGGCHVGETPAGAATRELLEETGIHSSPTALVGIYDSRFCGTRSKAHLYHFVFLCQALDESEAIAGPETIDVGWFGEEELPELSPGHQARVADVFRFVSTARKSAFFDKAEEA